MKKIYLIGLLLFGMIKSEGQVNYSFAASSGTYSPIVGGTSPTFTQVYGSIGAADEGYANSIPIGFTFNYNGTPYTTVSMNSNGFLAFVNMVPLVDASTEAYYADDLSGGPYTPTDVRPVIAPFWDDLDMVSTTNMKYQTTGVAGSRVFTMEWLNAKADYNATGPVISFQVKLYETTGKIEFIYRSESAAYNQTQGETDGFSIGLSAIDYGKYLSLSNASASPTASSTVNTTSITTKPSTGRLYTFTPNASLPISLLSFKAEKGMGLNKLSWVTSTEQNNKGFELQRSADGKNFTSISFVQTKSLNGNSTSNLSYSFDDIKPLRGSSFYRLKQVDKDNKAMYSQVVSLRGVVATRLEVRNIFPNPAISILKLVLAVPENDKVTVMVTDLNGKVVLQKAIDAVSGDNSVELNVSKLVAGNYMIKANCANGCEPVSTRFVKQ